MTTRVDPPTHWARSLAIAVGAALAVTLIVLAFLWPVATASAKDVPVAVVGDATALTQLEAGLADNAAGVFATTTYDSRDAAITAIERREVYGAVIAGAQPEVVVASAASPTVATALRNVARGLQTQISAQLAANGRNPSEVTVTVTDIVPFVDADPNGAGVAAIGFPIVLGGLVGGILISLLVTGVARRLPALAVYAIIAGAAVALITHSWFGILPGDPLALAVGMALAMLGTASFVVGINALIGPAGILIGSVTTMLIGNPLSAASMPVPFLAAPWGGVGQFFVPGAAATLVRDLSYFPSADTTQPWLVLTAWALLGVVLSAIGHWRNREVVHLPEPGEAPWHHHEHAHPAPLRPDDASLPTTRRERNHPPALDARSRR